MSKFLNATGDTNTQAMTEVALGLSMAFFSLLILALLSISAGKDMDIYSEVPVHTMAKQADANKALELILAQSRLSLSQADNQQDEQDTSVDSQNAASLVTFIFHYKGQYYDASLQPQALQNVNPDKATVVAVVPDLSFAEVMQVHKDFQDKDIQITAMDDNWQKAFSERVDKLALVSGS